MKKFYSEKERMKEVKEKKLLAEGSKCFRCNVSRCLVFVWMLEEDKTRRSTVKHKFETKKKGEKKNKGKKKGHAHFAEWKICNLNMLYFEKSTEFDMWEHGELANWHIFKSYRLVVCDTRQTASLENLFCQT